MNRGRRPYRRGNYDNQTVSNILEQIVGAISNMGDRQQGGRAQRGRFRGRGRGSRNPSHRRQAADPEENSYPRQRREGGSRGPRHTSHGHSRGGSRCRGGSRGRGVRPSMATTKTTTVSFNFLQVIVIHVHYDILLLRLFVCMFLQLMKNNEIHLIRIFLLTV